MCSFGGCPGLIQSLSQGLLPELSAWVEVGGIASSLCLRAFLLQPISLDGSLAQSLAGISLLANQLGFTHAPETLYAVDGQSAAFHADHGARAVSLAVECNPRQQTVSLAVSGLDHQDTFETFHQVSSTLFGDC